MRSTGGVTYNFAKRSPTFGSRTTTWTVQMFWCQMGAKPPVTTPISDSIIKVATKMKARIIWKNRSDSCLVLVHGGIFACMTTTGEKIDKNLFPSIYIYHDLCIDRGLWHYLKWISTSGNLYQLLIACFYNTKNGWPLKQISTLIWDIKNNDLIRGPALTNRARYLHKSFLSVKTASRWNRPAQYWHSLVYNKRRVDAMVTCVHWGTRKTFNNIDGRVWTKAVACLVWIYRYQRTRISHRGRVTHICVSNLTIIGSDNGLSPGHCQAIIWSSTGILKLRNKLQWNLKRNSCIFIQENAFENVVCWCEIVCRASLFIFISPVYPCLSFLCPSVCVTLGPFRWPIRRIFVNLAKFRTGETVKMIRSVDPRHTRLSSSLLNLLAAVLHRRLVKFKAIRKVWV